jgi:hypothetical protein
VNVAQAGDDLSLETGFLGDFADGRLLKVLVTLRVALRNTPIDSAISGEAANQSHSRAAVGG